MARLVEKMKRRPRGVRKDMGVKTSDELLLLPYTVEVVRDEDGYFARVSELPGCMTWTERIEDLWPMVEDAKRAWIGVALDCGDPVPEPENGDPEAVLVRMPDGLRRNLAQRASREGVSLERFVTATLARAVGE